MTVLSLLVPGSIETGAPDVRIDFPNLPRGQLPHEAERDGAPAPPQGAPNGGNPGGGLNYGGPDCAAKSLYERDPCGWECELSRSSSSLHKATMFSDILRDSGRIVALMAGVAVITVAACSGSPGDGRLILEDGSFVPISEEEALDRATKLRFAEFVSGLTLGDVETLESSFCDSSALDLQALVDLHSSLPIDEQFGVKFVEPVSGDDASPVVLSVSIANDAATFSIQFDEDPDRIACIREVSAQPPELARYMVPRTVR